MKLRRVSILQALCLIGAVSAYRGSDNRLTPGERERRKYFDRRPPEIEYHYPDSISNQISRQPHVPAVSHNVYHHPVSHVTGPGPWRRQTGYSGQDSSAGPWRKNVPLVGHVNHIKSDRRKPPTFVSTAGLHRYNQWGTARVPYQGATVNVIPSMSRRKTYRGVVTTTVLSPEEARKTQYLAGSAPTDSAQLVFAKQSSLVHVHSLSPDRGVVHDEPANTPDPCFNCPSDHTVLAKKGTKYAFLEKPTLTPCPNHPWIPDVKLEVVSKIKPDTPLSEGTHMISSKLVYHGQVLKDCHFRYTVVVRRCPQLEAVDQLIANCSAENVWGSRCKMTCQRGYQPLGFQHTECKDRQRWTQTLPQCIAVTGCVLPVSPENGGLSCSASDEDLTDLLGEGATCRYTCKDGYSIPSNQSHLADITCTEGDWNSTTVINCVSDKSASQTPQGTLNEPPTDKRRHRKHKNGRPRSTNPCRPNPCDEDESCHPGQQPYIALCSCTPDSTELVDNQPCHKMVLVKRLMDKKEKRNHRGTLVLGNVYGITPTVSEVGA